MSMKKLFAALGYIPAKPDSPPPLGRLTVLRDGMKVSVTWAGSTGEIVHNRIGFGDATTAWDNPRYAAIPHRYANKGTYQISLVLIDKWARVTETSETVVIGEEKVE